MWWNEQAYGSMLMRVPGKSHHGDTVKQDLPVAGFIRDPFAE